MTKVELGNCFSAIERSLKMEFRQTLKVGWDASGTITHDQAATLIVRWSLDVGL